MYLLLAICTNIMFAITENPDYKFTQLKIEDGLSQSTVYSIIQDKKGFMWFGTGNGLNKYDGYKFYIYSNNPSDSTTISDNGIISMYEDNEGIIWIGTSAGNINRFDRASEIFSHKNISDLVEKSVLPSDYYFDYPISFARNLSQTITAICEDLNHNLWIGTWGNGIIVIDKNFKLLNHFYSDLNDKKSSLPTNRIMDIQCDSDGNIWIATFGNGLLRADINDNKTYSIKITTYLSKSTSTKGDDFIIKVFEDRKKNLWIGTYYSGFFFLSADEKKSGLQQAKFEHYKYSDNDNTLSNNTVMYFDEDKEGNIWIGTLGGGLDRFNQKSKSFLNFKSDPLKQNSIADNDVLSLCIDKSGIIWVGSHLGKGVTKIQRNTTKFNLIGFQPNNPNSLNDGVVWAIHKDKRGLLWIGTYKGGLNCYDPLRNKLLFFKNKSNSKLSSNHIRAIVEDSYENLWIGTYDGGLNIYNKNTGEIKVYMHNFGDTNSISGNQIQTILIDGDNYYIGTFGGGINKISINGNPFNRQLKFRKFIHKEDDENSVSDNRIYKIYKDEEGLIWICTYGGGVNLFNPESETFKKYPNTAAEKENMTANNMMTILRDSYNTMWTGTYGGGLFSFEIESARFTRYSVREGMPSAVVYGILEDRLKNLWISSDNGIFKYDLINKDFTRFDIKDGLQSLEFSGGAYLYSNDGIMYFGGINGINFFRPEEIKTNTFIPPVVISSVKVLDNIIKGEPSELNLRYDENTISFEFASLDYSDPKDNLYAYILEGFDNDWQFTNSSLRIATYTNLSPGEYVFKVRGSNSDGIWNENYASITIIISPPFWKTYWFIVLASLFTILILYYVFTIRIKSQLAIEKLKSRLAADLHDNVGSGLTEISILSEVASRKNVSGSSNELVKISELSRQLVDNMSDIVWVVNPEKDSLHDLIIRLKNSYSEILSSMSCELKIKDIQKLKKIKIPIDVKQNLYLILKEAFNNAIKHSRASLIQMSFETEDDFLKIILMDNGIGMDLNKINLGNGISNMNKRASAIGWNLEIDSKEGDGTAIVFSGKIKSRKLSELLK
ncbi:Putative periplasmic ligand-binding sensor domain protein [Ignavibacterium album JCM 16511]|uniref:Putative periplasmic ligand-binding sensor domain protein n=2 Tax=Ignavibacterium album TaxID=591197 RepID=I0ANA5_IGNAJ|nr:Putative periplasmic ligand-binding sensor domain protein [Ignavibacterium album JCM 16511]